MATDSESELSEVFVELADTLTADFDLFEFLTRLCGHLTNLLAAGEAGVILADAKGALRVMASSTEQMRVLELFEVQNEEGPCLDAYRTAKAVINVDLAEADARWPRFAPLARADGFALVDAFPMRLRDEVAGVANVFCIDRVPLRADQVRVAQALADIATIGILQERGLREGRTITEQLQSALTTRVVVEQAKGVLAERTGLSMPEAFELLRSYCRVKNLRMGDTARLVVAGELSVEILRSPK